MAAPLSGAGQQQQLPVTQALQPISSDQSREVRQQEQEPRENEVQIREAPSAQAQKTERSDDSTFALDVNPSESSRTESSESRGDRGGVVDISV